jgi:hypothetical protein
MAMNPFCTDEATLAGKLCRILAEQSVFWDAAKRTLRPPEANLHLAIIQCCLANALRYKPGEAGHLLAEYEEAKKRRRGVPKGTRGHRKLSSTISTLKGACERAVRAEEARDCIREDGLAEVAETLGIDQEWMGGRLREWVAERPRRRVQTPQNAAQKLCNRGAVGGPPRCVK